jgi:hypothetical protein
MTVKSEFLSRERQAIFLFSTHHFLTNAIGGFFAVSKMSGT